MPTALQTSCLIREEELINSCNVVKGIIELYIKCYEIINMESIVPKQVIRKFQK